MVLEFFIVDILFISEKFFRPGFSTNKFFLLLIAFLIKTKFLIGGVARIIFLMFSFLKILLIFFSIIIFFGNLDSKILLFE